MSAHPLLSNALHARHQRERIVASVATAHHLQQQQQQQNVQHHQQHEEEQNHRDVIMSSRKADSPCGHQENMAQHHQKHQQRLLDATTYHLPAPLGAIHKSSGGSGGQTPRLRRSDSSTNLAAAVANNAHVFQLGNLNFIDTVQKLFHQQ